MPFQNRRTVISDMEQEERPRERLQKYGAKSLRKAELLAIILRVGVKGESVLDLADRLLSKYGGISGLHQANFHELRKEHGLGIAKASQLKASLELANRLLDEKLKDPISISSPDDLAKYLMYDMQKFEQEHMRVILLNTRNIVIDMIDVYKGSANSAQIRIGELFKDAVRQNATSIILAHNHPSGNPSPSPDDVKITQDVIKAGDILNIKVLDHLIFGRGEYKSLKKLNLIP